MDDLFTRQTPAPLTVTQLNARARQLLERHFTQVTVVGELSGHKIVSGHHYFCLKDRESQLQAVLFKREAAASKLELANGMEVLATGRLTIYSAYGRYQLAVERIEQRGAGALLAAFELLKARLAAEGLFAAERKRRLPLLPARVAVVTSPTGAVIRDIVHVATRRFPRARILVVPTRVQGADAAPQVAGAICKVSALAPSLGVDVLIVARGGGSLEDLWCFNDERVARAIHACSIPVVSGVGHETDVTIADFAADVRAPTPSAAAEIVFPIASELAAMLAQRLERSRSALRRDLAARRLHVRALKAELGDPRRLVREEMQRLAHARQRHEDAVRRMLLDRRLRLHQLEKRLAALHPRARLHGLRSAVAAARGRAELALRGHVERRRDRLTSLEHRLQALSPLGVLTRGYAIVQRQTGAVVQSAAEVAVGERLSIRLGQGGLDATVARVRPDDASASTTPKTRAIGEPHE